MKVIDKTIDLMEYTYRETSHKDKFPIKYRTIIFEMQTLEIICHLVIV